MGTALKGIRVENIKLPYSDSSETKEISPGVYRISPELWEISKMYFYQIDRYRSYVPSGKIPFSFVISNPIVGSEPKDIAFVFDDYTYTLFVDSDDGNMICEAISRKGGGVVAYRDSSETLGNMNYEMVGEKFKNLPNLLSLCDPGVKIGFRFSGIRFEDINDINWDVVHFNFGPRQLEEINKVFPQLFPISISEVLRDGSYYMTERRDIDPMPFGLGGSGYRSLLLMYDLWCKYTDNGGTLLINNWDRSLHPLLKRAVLDLIKKKSNRSDGTLFLAGYGE